MRMLDKYSRLESKEVVEDVSCGNKSTEGIPTLDPRSTHEALIGVREKIL